MNKWLKWTLVASIVALLVATVLIIQVFKSDNRIRQVDEEQNRRADEYQPPISGKSTRGKTSPVQPVQQERKFRVWGKLYNSTGEPMPQERIDIIMKIQSTALAPDEKPFAQIRETDVDGGFEFAGVPKGEYYISAMTQYFHLIVNSDTNFDVKLLPFATINGKVVSDEGPVTGGKIIMKSQIVGTPFVMQVTSQIAQDGSFAFGMVRPSLVSVCAVSPDYAAAFIEPFEVEAGKVYPLEIKVKRGVTFTGTVIDESGKPVADATVSVGGDYDMFEIRTDVDGKFTTSALDSKDYVVVVRKEGFAITTGTISPGKQNLINVVHTGSVILDPAEDGTVVIRHSRGTHQIKVEAGKGATMQSIPCGDIIVDFVKKDGSKSSQAVRLTPDGVVVNVPNN